MEGNPALLDLVFCVDCTGSMVISFFCFSFSSFSPSNHRIQGSYISQVQAKINFIINKIIASEQADVRYNHKQTTMNNNKQLIRIKGLD